MSKKINTCLSRKYREDVDISAPHYIDENTNLEAPSMQSTAEWVSSGSTFLPTTGYSVKFIQDSTNTASSGYCSSSSHLAHPQCLFDEAFESCSQPEFEKSSNVMKKCVSEGHSPFSMHRSQSCNAGWFVKRRRSRQSFPRLSGICRPTESSKSGNNLGPLSMKSRVSCYSDLFGGDNESDVSGYANKRKKYNVRFAEVFSPDVSEADKMRVVSKTTVIPVNISPVKAMNSFNYNLDDTLPLDNSGSSTDSLHPSTTVPLELDRNHSTPLCRIKNRLPTVEQFKQVHISVPRCFSVPANLDTNRNLDRNYDGFGPCVLPVVERSGAGLNFVSADTVASLLNGQDTNKNIKFLIIDCRYPYEYDGGHVRNAVNIYTPNELLQEVFRRIPAQNPSEGESPIILGDKLDQMLAVANPNIRLPVVNKRLSNSSSEDPTEEQDSELEEDIVHETQSVHGTVTSDRHKAPSPQNESPHSPNWNEKFAIRNPEKPTFMVIFHCEFSSQRAPFMTTFLRRLDRTTNQNRYPFLFFPELYVMKGGYSEFHKRFPEHCEPPSYVRMFDSNFRAGLRLYNRLAKQVGAACQTCFQNPGCYSRYSPNYNVLEHSSSENRENIATHLRRAATMNTDVLTSPTFAYRMDRKCPKFGILKQRNACFDAEDHSSVYSKLAGIGSTSSPDPYAPEILDDDSLRLAEAVVRVGEHVTSVILSGQNEGRFKKQPNTPEPAPLPMEEDQFTPISSAVTLSREPLIKFSLNNSQQMETPVAPTRKL